MVCIRSAVLTHARTYVLTRVLLTARVYTALHIYALYIPYISLSLTYFYLRVIQKISRYCTVHKARGLSEVPARAGPLVWCVPALRVPFVGSFSNNINHFRQVSQSVSHYHTPTYQRSTWPTVHSIFLVQRDLWTDYPEPGKPIFSCRYLSRSSRDLVDVVVVDLGRRGQPCQGRVLGGLARR